jgi:hypothetical protein
VEGYVGAIFSTTPDGLICSYCRSFKSRTFLGELALVRDLALGANEQIGVTVSGGKDSTNVWLWLVKNFGADRIVAFNHKKVGLVHPMAEENLKKAEAKLGSQLVQLEDHEFYPRFKRNLEALLARPDPAMVRTGLCAGCRVGISGRIFEEAKKWGIKKIVNGSSYLELAPFKSELMRIKGLGSETRGLLAGLQENDLYYFQGNLRTIMTDVEHCHESDLSQGKSQRLYPYTTFIDFYKYLPNVPSEIEKRIVSELDWKKPAEDDWHSDCFVGEFKNLFYYKLLGYTEVDYKLCEMIRYRLLERNEALTKLYETRLKIITSVDRLISFLRREGCGNLAQQIKDFVLSPIPNKYIVDGYRHMSMPEAYQSVR